MTWYRMSDNEHGPRPAIPCSRDDAEYYNDPARQFGIFATVNEFNGPRRKDCLVRIRAWAIDIDAGTKDQMRSKLLASPLVPSLIVETKRGYQAYWVAKQPARPEHWNAIVLERLVPRFGADNNARDLCRILRVPGYYHLKDPSDPFLVRVAWRHPVSYSERQMAEAFHWIADPVAQRQAHDEARREAEREIREQARQDAIAAGLTLTESLWDAIYALDCEEGLQRLSGHWAVGGETYTFRRTARGHLNIFVNGKSSPCFLDANKRIGSPSGGGPTLVQWLRWFKHDWKTVIAVMKEIFPRLDEIDKAARAAQRRTA